MEKEIWLINAVGLFYKYMKWERGKRACSLLSVPTPLCCGSGSTRTWRCCGRWTLSRRTSCGSTSSATSGTWSRSRRPSRPWRGSPPQRPGSPSRTSWSRSSASTECGWPPASASQRWDYSQYRGRKMASALKKQPWRAIKLLGSCSFYLVDWSSLPHSISKADLKETCFDLKINRALKSCACQTESQVLKPKRIFPILLNCHAHC